MNNRVLYLIVGGVGLCALVFWFTQTYTLQKERVWVGMQGEARVNQLLAARLLLQRMGARVQESSDLHRLDDFPSTGTLFFAADRSQLDPSQVRRLMLWVKRGGHLVVAAGPARHRDQLLDAAGVHVSADADSKPSLGPEDVELPDGSHVRAVLRSPVVLDAAPGATDWRHTYRGATRMLQLPTGDGLITVMSTFRPFTNREIGRFEHAELLWWLASEDERPVPVWLVRHLDLQSLPQWLVKNALPVVVALAIFLLLWLWRVIPRFGPIQPDPQPDRRSLSEHLRAVGRFYSMQRKLPTLLQSLRQDGLDLLDQKAPETRGLDGAARLKSAARLSGLRARDLLHAFTAEIRTPHDFTLATRTLSQFRHRLSLPARTKGKRRRAPSEEPPRSAQRIASSGRSSPAAHHQRKERA